MGLTGCVCGGGGGTSPENAYDKYAVNCHVTIYIIYMQHNFSARTYRNDLHTLSRSFLVALQAYTNVLLDSLIF